MSSMLDTKPMRATGGRSMRRLAGVAAIGIVAALVSPANAAPRPTAGPAGLPPGAGTVLYDNTARSTDYYGGQGESEAIDDLHLASGGSLDLLVFECKDLGVGGPFSATVRLYDNPEGLDLGLVPLAGPYQVTGIATGSVQSVSVPLPDAPVVGKNLWVGIQFSSSTAGLIRGGSPSPGSSHDLYFENNQGNLSGPFDFGGNPLANFALKLVDTQQYDLQVLVVGDGTVSKLPDQAKYVGGTSVELTAHPGAHQHFAGWSGSATGAANPLLLAMDGDKVVTAAFATDTYVLLYHAGTNGMITGPNPQVVDYGSDGQLVTAVPDAGYHFASWDDGYPLAARHDLNVTANLSATASFAIDTYALAVTVIGQGTVTKAPELPVYDRGTTVQLEATPATGWHFVSWGGDAAGTTSPVDVTMDAAKSVTGTFAINTYALGVTVIGQGSVGRSPDQLAYDHGTVVHLTATPATGWHFAAWSGGAAGTTSPVDVTMDAAKSVTATFEINTYALGVTVIGQGSVAKSPDQLAYDHGTVVHLTATPATGWHFAAWSGDAAGTTSPVDVTMDAAKSVTATFAINTVTLGVTTQGQGTVAKNPDQTVVNLGSSVVLTALPAAAWRFADWSGDASGTANPLTVVMDANKAIEARFILNAIPVAVAVGIPAAGTIPLVVDFSGATSTDADGDSLVFHWTFGDGANGFGRRVSHAYTALGNYVALLTVDDGHGATDTASVAISTQWRFPQTRVLDAFNRANGSMGSSWTDQTSKFAIASNRLGFTGSIGYAEWNAATFGPDQETFVTFGAILASAAELNLMLKTQGTSWTFGHIEVSYRPSLGSVIVETLTPPGTTFVRAGEIAGVTFAAGDQFGARARADGTVDVFKNGHRIGGVSVAGWAYAALGGRIGVSYDAVGPSQFDDFGGGEYVDPAAGLVAISQIYGGGGAAGATLTHDFVELFNRGDRAVNLAGWSVQIADATATSWSVTALTGTIPPGGYFLVREAAGGGGTVNLPTPDCLGNIPMNATAGKVALVSDTVPLSGACPAGTRIADFVGYGGANCAESSPASATGVATALFRGDAGCRDTGRNSSDFATGTPAPRNSASPRLQCAAWLAVGDAAPSRIELGAPVPNPNPFRQNLRVEFVLPASGSAHVQVLDLQGRRIATLADGVFEAGRHQVSWNGTSSGEAVRAGVYFVRMEALGQRLIRKVAVTR